MQINICMEIIFNSPVIVENSGFSWEDKKDLDCLENDMDMSVKSYCSHNNYWQLLLSQVLCKVVIAVYYSYES